MSANPAPRPPLRLRLLKAGSVLALVGAAAWGFHLWHTEAHLWRPLDMPLTLQAGYQVERDFVAELDADHEVEVEFSLHIPAEKIKQLATAVYQPSALDLDWSVHEGERQLAAGTCRDYLYIKPSGNEYYKNWVRMALNIPYHQGMPGGGGVIGRGVGLFTAQAGRTYTVRARVGEEVEGVGPGQVRLGIRLNRALWTRRYNQTKGLAVAGLAAMGLGAAVALGAGGLAWRAGRLGRDGAKV